MNTAVGVTVIATVLTCFLALLKLITGHYGQSHALFADGVHSVSDIVVNIFVLFAAYYGNKQADYNHPYGHGRIETMGTLGFALVLLMAGVGIMIDAGEHLWGKLPAPTPNQYVLWTAVMAIVLNEALFQYTIRLAKKIQSSLLTVSAWHIRSDVGVSLVVLLGIIGSLIGFPFLDAIGAVFVGVMICKMSGSLVWKSISELVDTGVDQAMLNKIRAIIIAVPEVRALHLLRTRRVNAVIFLDVHILVSPYITVSEGHFIGDQVTLALSQQLPEITDITVHVDPEDDEIMPVTLPVNPSLSRTEILRVLAEDLKKLSFFADIHDIRLHYLNQQIRIELLLGLFNINNINNINNIKILKKTIKKFNFIKNIVVYARII